MVPDPLRVARVQRETADTVTVSLESPLAFPFVAGQFNMLYAFAVGEVPISMSGDPAREHEIVHTIRSVGAVSRALCSLRKGAVVGVRGPFGQPWPVEAARGMDLLLVAGGVGLAPLRPLVCHVLRHRADYGRVALLVGARTPGDLLYRRELARWQQRADLRVLTTVDRAGADWTGRIGVVPQLLDEITVDAARTAAVLCGPEVMMRFTIRQLVERGVPDDRIYLSLERNMKCAVGFCGHCQFGPSFVCKDGPVFRYDRIDSLFWLREV
jgi:NAD(P)H-flavin reductase